MAKLRLHDQHTVFRVKFTILIPDMHGYWVITVLSTKVACLRLLKENSKSYFKIQTFPNLGCFMLFCFSYSVTNKVQPNRFFVKLFGGINQACIKELRKVIYSDVLALAPSCDTTLKLAVSFINSKASNLILFSSASG